MWVPPFQQEILDYAGFNTFTAFQALKFRQLREVHETINKIVINLPENDPRVDKLKEIDPGFVQERFEVELPFKLTISTIHRFLNHNTRISLEDFYRLEQIPNKERCEDKSTQTGPSLASPRFASRGKPNVKCVDVDEGIVSLCVKTEIKKEPDC